MRLIKRLLFSSVVFLFSAWIAFALMPARNARWRRSQLLARGVAAFPVVPPQVFVDGFCTLRSKRVPLSGVPFVTTMFGGIEGEGWIEYVADEAGFRNPVGTHERVNQVVLLGDSFTHGYAVQKDIAGYLRDGNLSVASLGMCGNGPLAELGSWREFGARLQPSHVFWLYYEENDLYDYVREKHSVLARYRDNTFSQRLWTERVTVGEEVREAYRKGNPQPSSEISDSAVNVLDFASVVRQARDEVERTGARFTFVYLPWHSRFAVLPHPADHWRTPLLAALRDVQVLDLVPVFAAQDDPLLFWPRREHMHYAANGYEAVANAIVRGL